MRYIPELSPGQCAEALSASHALWGGGQTPADRLAKLVGLMRDWPGRLSMAGLVDDAGRVTASLKRYALVLDLPDPSPPRPAVGLGAIFTAPERRKQGLAERLVRTVLDEAYAGGASGALLFSDIDPKYYERFGFAALPAFTGWARTQDLPPADALAPAPPEPGFMLAVRAAGLPPGTVRAHVDAAHRDFFRRLNFTGQDFLLKRGGEAVGTLSACFEEDSLWVEELYCLETAAGAPEQAWGLVRRLAEERGLKRVGSWMDPPGPLSAFKLTARAKAIPMLAAAPGSALRVPPERAWFGSLDHF